MAPSVHGLPGDDGGARRARARAEPLGTSADRPAGLVLGSGPARPGAPLHARHPSSISLGDRRVLGHGRRVGDGARSMVCHRLGLRGGPERPLGARPPPHRSSDATRASRGRGAEPGSTCGGGRATAADWSTPRRRSRCRHVGCLPRPRRAAPGRRLGRPRPPRRRDDDVPRRSRSAHRSRRAPRTPPRGPLTPADHRAAATGATTTHAAPSGAGGHDSCRHARPGRRRLADASWSRRTTGRVMEHAPS